MVADPGRQWKGSKGTKLLSEDLLPKPSAVVAIKSVVLQVHCRKPSLYEGVWRNIGQNSLLNKNLPNLKNNNGATIPSTWSGNGRCISSSSKLYSSLIYFPTLQLLLFKASVTLTFWISELFRALFHVMILIFFRFSLS